MSTDIPEDIKQHNRTEPPRPLSPSVPAVAGGQLVRAAAYASDSGESLHCFLVGVITSYVIATADLVVTSFMLPTCFLPNQKRDRTTRKKMLKDHGP